jgi:DNA-binding MarR family transcriptional regulator
MSKNFTGVWIPRAIYQDTRLTPTDKLILADIASLCLEGGNYFKSNDTIAAEVNVSVPSVSRSIKKLAKLGLITSQYDGRTRLIKMIRALIKMIKQTNQNDKGTNQNDKADLSKRLDSIHSSIQTSKHISKEVVFPFDSKEFREAWCIWIDERKQKKIRKYTQRGEQAALKRLAEESNHNEVLAIKMIHNAIARGWQGIYPLKNEKRNNTTREPINKEAALKWASGSQQ